MARPDRYPVDEEPASSAMTRAVKSSDPAEEPR
jgi:hypothetical protein